MATVADLAHALAKIAPLHLAQHWDNVGLIVGDTASVVRRCLLCIDMTETVVREAAKIKAQAIVAYHPPIFTPFKHLRTGPEHRHSSASAVFQAIRSGLAVYSPHTALDAADGGTGDAIAALCGATIVGPLAPHRETTADEVKIVVFIPPSDTERVASAMFAAGAGHIGLYNRCSFRIPGTGTFFGSEQTDPTIGKKGRMEFVDEIRLETVCPAARLHDVISALRGSHPYEEPAFDVYCLVPKPAQVGIGRLARLRRPEPLGRLARRLATATGNASPQIIGAPRARVQALAILVGSAGRVDQDFPRALDADVLITGEIRHHDAVAFRARGWSAIALGHWASERPVLKRLAKAISGHLAGIDMRISHGDADPFASV